MNGYIDTTPLLAGGCPQRLSAGRVPLPVWLAEASAVVQVRTVRIAEDSMVCEVLLFLDNCRIISGGTEARIFGITVELPGEVTLNRNEDQIMAIIRSGSYLMPGPDYMSPLIRSSDAIVRARLRKIEARATAWEVIGEPLFVALCKQRNGALAWRFVGFLRDNPKYPNHLDKQAKYFVAIRDLLVVELTMPSHFGHLTHHG